MAHTIQDMSELEAAQAILEDVRIIIECLPVKALTLQVTDAEYTFGTLLDNIEEAAEHIIDLNLAPLCLNNPNK